MVATSTVTASPRSQPEVFYRQTVFRIARSWARVPNAAWDRVKDPLFSQCPHALDYNNESSEIKNLVLGTNDRLSIIGLGLYFLESKGCHGQHIVPYLLWIEDKLLDISFSERQSGRFSLPVAEVFAFAINTLLSDMAVVDGGFRTMILDAQMSLLEKCVTAIEKAKESDNDDLESNWNYCDSLIPVTFGLCRALGRFGLADNFLITRVFPQEAPPPSPASQLITAKQSFSNFREIRRKSSSSLMPSPSPYALSRLPSVVVKEATPNPDDQDQVPPMMPKRKPSMVRQISLSSKEKLQVIQDHVRSRYLELKLELEKFLHGHGTTNSNP